MHGAEVHAESTEVLVHPVHFSIIVAFSGIKAFTGIKKFVKVAACRGCIATVASGGITRRGNEAHV